MVALAQVSATPPFVSGFLDLFPDEPPQPVLRLDDLLDLPRDPALPGLHTPLVVCRAGGSVPGVALLVRRVEGVVAATPMPLAARADATFNGCVSGLLPSGDDARPPALLLSLGNLLLEEEAARLRHFARIAGERRENVSAGGTAP